MIVTICICEPVIETNWPAHIRRKSRWRSAANDDGRPPAGGRVVSSVGENLGMFGNCYEDPYETNIICER